MTTTSVAEDNAPPARECGACQVCCSVTTIDLPEIQKVSGSPCRHSLGGTCAIYDSRPGVCRSFYCGWRLSRDFPDDWRPDLSGIFTVLEDNPVPQFQPIAVAIYLVGDPLETVRKPDFIDFVVKNIRRRVALYLVLPAGRGMLAPRLPLNIRPVMEAAAKSPFEVGRALEATLKQLMAHPTTAYVMKNRGNDFSDIGDPYVSD